MKKKITLFLYIAFVAAFLLEGVIHFAYDRIKMPPEKETDARAGTIGIRNNRLHLQISFPEPVNAKNVASVILNDVEVFRKAK